MKPILRWQYEQISKCLLLIQGHGSNIECPCSSEGEMCLRKHFMELEALCEETSPICDDDGMKQKLFDLAKEAREMRADEELKLCGKESKLDTDIAEWARNWRKPLEQASLVCGVAEAGESPLMGYLREMAVAELHIPAPFGWVGGKRQLAHRIVSLLPPHKTYVEPFCGAASVFWAKEPSEVEVLNDLDPDLMRFYQGIGSVTKCDVVQLSRDWEKLKGREGKLGACEFLAETLCSFGTGRGTYSPERHSCPENAPQFHKYLPQYQVRLKDTKLHNEDWRKVVEQYDSPDTFFYLDPPYHGTSRKYKYGEDQLVGLAEVLPNLKGKWLLSYDDDPDVRQAFAKFNIVPVTSRYTIMAGSKKAIGRQLLIANYPLEGEMEEGKISIPKKVWEDASLVCMGVAGDSRQRESLRKTAQTVVAYIYGLKEGEMEEKVLTIDQKWNAIAGEVIDYVKMLVRKYDLALPNIVWIVHEVLTAFKSEKPKGLFLKEGEMGGKKETPTTLAIGQIVSIPKDIMEVEDYRWGNATGYKLKVIGDEYCVVRFEGKMVILAVCDPNGPFVSAKHLYGAPKGEVQALINEGSIKILGDHPSLKGASASEPTEEHPYAQRLPGSIDVYSNVIEKHYLPVSRFHKGSIRVVKPTAEILVYFGCLKEHDWDPSISICSPNPTILKTVVPNTKHYQEELEHLKLVHPEVKVNYLPHEVGVEPRVAEGELPLKTEDKSLLEVVEAMNKAEEV